MSIETALWLVGDDPKPVQKSELASEQLLEDMIVKRPEVLSTDWMLIGRQVRTSYNTPLDLLAIALDGTLVLIELKRDKTPREVVAQAIDYASWIEDLQADEIQDIYESFSNGGNLSKDFQNKFGVSLNEDDVNKSHQIVVVAAKLDASSERIINYLGNKGIAINVLFFQVFQYQNQQILSRTWLKDPVEIQSQSTTTAKRASIKWNGEYYCSFGHSKNRNWEEARRYGFVCGGGGSWYSRTLNQLQKGDIIWVKSPGDGFVGYGKVCSQAIPYKDYQIETDDGQKPAAEVLVEAEYHKEFIDDPEKCEYFVSVDWIKTVPISEGIQELGMFGNQNTVCKPTTPQWVETVEKLKSVFIVNPRL